MFITELLVIDINRYKYTFYTINKDYIIIRKGKFITKKTFIPIKQIKYITIINGPLLNRYKLANIVFATGASSHEIEGLDFEVANDIKENILSIIEVKYNGN
ncbi:MAG: PH domain-containing protein [Clostridiales bacterium]|nr:PH domain-containing protein [Clostridiales bacterium]